MADKLRLDGDICINCNKRILPGHVVFCWNDESDMHADCARPFARDAQPDDQGNVPKVFSATSPYYRPLAGNAHQ